MNLVKRKLPISSCCPRCGKADETVIHALFECIEARKVWQFTPFSSVIYSWHEQSFMSFMDHASWSLSKEELDQFGFVAWRIWHDRNLMVHNQETSDAHTSYSATMHRYNEYKKAVVSKGRGVKEKQKQWHPPSSGKVKLNTDGAFVADKKVGGAGVVIRNDKGELAVARTIPLYNISTPRHAEILAISLGLQLALEVGFSQVEIETDAQSVVSELFDAEGSLAVDGHLLDGIKTLMRRLVYASCSYVPRCCNEVAHELSQYAVKNQADFTWIANFPSWLQSRAQADVNASGL